MISASKTTFSQYNLKILRLKVKKNLNLLEKFCEFLPRIILEILGQIFIYRIDFLIPSSSNL